MAFLGNVPFRSSFLVVRAIQETTYQRRRTHATLRSLGTIEQRTGLDPGLSPSRVAPPFWIVRSINETKASEEAPGGLQVFFGRFLRFQFRARVSPPGVSWNSPSHIPPCRMTAASSSSAPICSHPKSV